jgi:hypothetical protein
LANQIPEEALAAIKDALRRNPNGVSAPEILPALATPVPPRTLQYRLKHLVTRNRLVMDGEGRWARYRMPEAAIDAAAQEEADKPFISLSEAGTAIREYVHQAPEARRAVGYDRKFLDRYRPNAFFYLTEQDRRHLAAVGRPQIAEQPAGTCAKQIFSRLLIDLAWNSSRLEGNTYIAWPISGPEAIERRRRRHRRRALSLRPLHRAPRELLLRQGVYPEPGRTILKARNPSRSR